MSLDPTTATTVTTNSEFKSKLYSEGLSIWSKKMTHLGWICQHDLQAAQSDSNWMAEGGKLKSVLALRLEFPDWDPIKWLFRPQFNFFASIKCFLASIQLSGLFGLASLLHCSLWGSSLFSKGPRGGLLRTGWRGLDTIGLNWIGEQRGNGRSLPADF